MTTAQTSPVQRLDSIRRDLAAKRGQVIKWREMATFYPGVPAGTLCAILKGRDPRKPAIRAALGLPVLWPVPACPKCGVAWAETPPAERVWPPR